MKTGNEIIAEYMDFIDGGNFWASRGKPFLDKDGSNRFYPGGLLFDESIEWLYPVYIKIRKEFNDLLETEKVVEGDLYYHFLARRNNIVSALVSGDIPELHKEIVKGIEFLKEQKK